MLYPEQNEKKQWYSKAQASNYPLHVSERESADSFLTSRLRIKIDSTVDIGELSELALTLSRLVPWQVVLEVAVSIKTEYMGIKLVIAANMYHVANFSPY